MKKRHRANSVNRGAWQERMFDEKCNENNNYTCTQKHKNTDAYQKKENKNKTDLFTTNVAYKFE